MFVTHQSFKYPIQLQRDSTVWPVVELMLPTPWFVFTVEAHNDQETRSFFVSHGDTLLQLLSAPKLGRALAVDLVLPPRCSRGNQWSFVQIRRVDREVRSVDGSAPTAIVTAADGRRYGGYPIEPVVREEADLELLVEFAEQSS